MYEVNSLVFDSFLTKLITYLRISHDLGSLSELNIFLLLFFYGKGPKVNVTTNTKPELQHDDDDETLNLIILSSHIILLQRSHFVDEPASFTYNSSHPIINIGIHVSKELFFAIDEMRAIYM